MVWGDFIITSSEFFLRKKVPNYCAVVIQVYSTVQELMFRYLSTMT